jgi:2-oxoglutarate ferredoxin oxidoreductase subunit beta
MLIDLHHGEPIRFGAQKQFGVFRHLDGSVFTDTITPSNESQIVIHDETAPDPSGAFALSRLTRSDHEPTPVGVFRSVSRPEYGDLMSAQIVESQERDGLGDLAALFRGNGSWTVNP